MGEDGTMAVAPLDWAWYLFPLEHEGAETLALDAVVRYANELLDRDEAAGERERMGDILHWAHHLKTVQTDAGDWPALVNARSGEATGPARTLAPARLMRRLEHLLHSTEFTDCIARAGRHHPTAPKEPNS